MAIKRTAEETRATATAISKRRGATAGGNQPRQAEARETEAGASGAGTGASPAGRKGGGGRRPPETKAAKSRRVLGVLGCLIVAAFVTTIAFWLLIPSSAAGSTFHFSQKGVAFAAAGGVALFMSLLALYAGIYRYLWTILALPLMYAIGVTAGPTPVATAWLGHSEPVQAGLGGILFVALGLLYVTADATWHYIARGEVSPNLLFPDQVARAVKRTLTPGHKP